MIRIAATFNQPIGAIANPKPVRRNCQNPATRLFSEVKAFAMDNDLGPSEKPVEDKSSVPEVGERVLVRCPGFRCLAYRDAQGKWRNANGGEELSEVLEVLLRF